MSDELPPLSSLAGRENAKPLPPVYDPFPMRPHKFGNVMRGDWQWSIACDTNRRAPNIIATFNFHGCISSGYDPAQLAALFSAAPDLLAACKDLVKSLEYAAMALQAPCNSTMRAGLADAKAAIAKAEDKTHG